MPNLGAFGSCCGLNQAHGFGDTQSVINFLQDLMVHVHAPNVVFVLNNGQYRQLHSQFEKYNVRVATRLHNWVHNSILYLCVWEANPERNPDNPRFMSDVFKDITHLRDEEYFYSNDENLRIRGEYKGVVPHTESQWFMPKAMREYKRGSKDKPKPVMGDGDLRYGTARKEHKAKIRDAKPAQPVAAKAPPEYVKFHPDVKKLKGGV